MLQEGMHSPPMLILLCHDTDAVAGVSSALCSCRNLAFIVHQVHFAR